MRETKASRSQPASEPAVQFLRELAGADAENLNSPDFARNAMSRWVSICGGNPEDALRAAVRLLATLGRQREKLVEALNAVQREVKPSLAWMLSSPFDYRFNGTVRRFVHCVPLNRESGVPVLFEYADGLSTAAAAPRLPALALVDEVNRLFLGMLTDVPEPPGSASILTVSAAWSNSAMEGIGELEVTDVVADDSEVGRRSIVMCPADLAREVATKLEDGETVRVRVRGGVATAIHQTLQQKREPWLTEVPLEGPLLREMVFPQWLHKEFERDQRRILRNRKLRVALIGPTGVGKTEAVTRLARQTARQMRDEGQPCRGAFLVRLSPTTIGSTFQHGTEINMRRAMDHARSLRRRGYLVLVLADEADALFGETDDVEHTHRKVERLAFQELVNDDFDLPLFLTMNPRRDSWLPAAIASRFRFRSYPRMSRSQAAAIAAYYVTEPILRAFNMRRDEFGGAMADNLFSNERIVATAHFRSGRTMNVYARDLHCCSPRKIKDLLETLHDDLEDGLPRRLGDLWAMIDRDIQADLNVRNFWTMTFLEQPADDMLVVVKPVSRQ